MNYQDWINHYDIKNTKDAALKAYKSLNTYLKDTKQDEMNWIDSMQGDNDIKYHRLSELVNHISKQVDPATVKMYYNFWKSYLRFVHGIKIYSEDTKVFVKMPKIIKRNREPLTKDIIKELCIGADNLRRAEYIVLSSSGMRISEFLNTDQENFDLDTGKIKIMGKLTKTQAERITFISNEAIKAIDQSGAEFWEKRNYHNEASYFHRLREKLKLVERYDGSVVHKITLHSFRSFFRTQAGKINQDFAEQMIGHSYLKYVRLEPKELAEQYKKLEPKIKIF